MVLLLSISEHAPDHRFFKPRIVANARELKRIGGRSRDSRFEEWACSSSVTSYFTNKSFFLSPKLPAVKR